MHQNLLANERRTLQLERPLLDPPNGDEEVGGVARLGFLARGARFLPADRGDLHLGGYLLACQCAVEARHAVVELVRDVLLATRRMKANLFQRGRFAPGDARLLAHGGAVLDERAANPISAQPQRRITRRAAG